MTCMGMRRSMRWRPVEAREVSAGGREAASSSMQQFHLVRAAFSGDENRLRRRNLRHLRRAEVC